MDELVGAFILEEIADVARGPCWCGESVKVKSIAHITEWRFPSLPYLTASLVHRLFASHMDARG